MIHGGIGSADADAIHLSPVMLCCAHLARTASNVWPSTLPGWSRRRLPSATFRSLPSNRYLHPFVHLAIAILSFRCPCRAFDGGFQTADANDQRDALLDPRCTRSLPLGGPAVVASGLLLPDVIHRCARSAPPPTERAARRSRRELRRSRVLRVSLSVRTSPADPD